MKRLFAASSVVAAATLVSAAALAGANGALAAEPVRLDAAQLDAVTAGATEKIKQSFTTITGDQAVTETIVTVIENGKTTFFEETVVEGPAAAALPSEVAKRLAAIADLRLDIMKVLGSDL